MTLGASHRAQLLLSEAVLGRAAVPTKLDVGSVLGDLSRGEAVGKFGICLKFPPWQMAGLRGDSRGLEQQPVPIYETWRTYCNAVSNNSQGG